MGITSISVCESIEHKYEVNMQLIDLGFALDFKGCMLDIKIKKGCRLDILKVLGCMLDICRFNNVSLNGDKLGKRI